MFPMAPLLDKEDSREQKSWQSGFYLWIPENLNKWNFVLRKLINNLKHLQIKYFKKWSNYAELIVTL